MIRINDRLEIPEWELRFSTSRSSGPGGQHVNKVESRVSLGWSIVDSPSLDEAQRQRLLGRLASRVTKAGELQMHCQLHRSQSANREELVQRFAELLREALRPRRRRRKTRPGPAAVKRRLDAKRQRGHVKRERRSGSADDF